MCVIVRPAPAPPPQPLSSFLGFSPLGYRRGGRGGRNRRRSSGGSGVCQGAGRPGVPVWEEVGDPVLFQNSAERESVSLQGVSGASTTAFSGDVARFGPRPVPKSGARMMGPTEKPVSKPVSSLASAGERPRAQNRPNPPISSAGPVARQRRAHRRTPLPVAESLKRLHDISL